MVKIVHLFLPVFLLTAAITAQGQTNYQPGSLLLSNGQQTNGLIDYREWRQNPRKISFKKDPESQVVQYGTEELQAFNITGKDSFERAIVTKDMQPVEMHELMGLPD